MDTLTAAFLAVYVTGAAFHTLRVGENLNNAELQTLLKHRQADPLEVCALALASIILWPVLDLIAGAHWLLTRK